jgi:Carboxypeptidase regulatory-like domain
MQRITLALVLLLTSLCGQLFGQASATGAVNGTVTDPSGQVVAGAKVVLLAESTNISTTVTTNGEGQYHIQNVLPSLYNLTVQGAGFKAVQVAPFRINVNQTVTVDVTLQLGELSQKVEISAQSELVQRTTVELSTVIQDKPMRDLPLNGRDYTQLITLTPGANGTRVNGNWGDGNSFLLDGAVNTTVMGGNSAYKPILDTIQEFSIQAHSDKAEYGGVTGATIQVASRSGGNKITGSVWEFVRNDIFLARNPITQATLSKPPAFRQNQFGGTFGGPVVIPKIYNGKNRTFFFFAHERYLYRKSDVLRTRVPTANELAGNFSDSVLGRNIFDPGTTVAGPNSTQVRQQFPNNIIPADQIDKMTQGYVRLRLADPNYFSPSDLSVNRFDILPNKQNKEDYSLKVDHKFSDKDNLWFRLGYLNYMTTTFPSAKVVLDNPQNRRSIGVNWTHLFTPSLFSDVRFSYSNHPFRYITTLLGLEGGGIPAVEALGFSASKIDAYTLPNLGGTGSITLPGLNFNYGTLTSLPYAFNGSLSWIKGKHNAKYGFQLTRKDFTNVQFSNNYTFNLSQTADPQNTGQTGIELASLLLGLPNSTTQQDGSYHEAFSNWGLYVQDEWKFRSNLTFNFGLRWDAFPLPNFFGRTGLINDWDWKTGEWLIGGTKLPPGCDVSHVAPCIPGNGNLANIDHGDKIRLADYPGVRHPINDNFSPRVSAAYSLNQKTVLRAGYGIYFDTESSTAQEAQNTYGQWPSNTSVQGTYNQVGQAFTTVRQVDLSVISPVTTGAPWGKNTYFWDPKKKNAMIQQYNVDIQREIDKNLIVTVAYVGSRGTRLDLNLSANTAPTPGPGSAAEVTARRPFPYMIRDVLYGTDLGRTYYNGLQVKVDRRFANGLQALVSYTWSKAMDNGTDGFYVGNPQDAYNLAAEHGLSNSDRTHMLRISGIYELPFGTGKRWLSKGPAAYILGNWQFNTISSLTSGTPVVLSVSGDIANVGNSAHGSYMRPNVVGNPSLSNPSMNLWFNTSAFAVPVLSFGNAGRGLVRSPAFYNSDLSLFKNIPIKERISAQLRLEAFNAFNIINPGSPSGNASTGNTNFGRITSISGSTRDVQLALKIMFF